MKRLLAFLFLAAALASPALLPALAQTVSQQYGIYANALRGQLPGTNTNDNASAGNIGETSVVQIVVGGAVALTTNTDANVTQLSLTVGDWLVSGNICYTSGATTTTTIAHGWTSVTSASIPNAPNEGAYSAIYGQMLQGASVAGCHTIGNRRYILAGTTTVYLSTRAAFGVSTLSAYGALVAVRIR